MWSTFFKARRDEMDALSITDTEKHQWELDDDESGLKYPSTGRNTGNLSYIFNLLREWIMLCIRCTLGDLKGIKCYLKTL